MDEMQQLIVQLVQAAMQGDQQAAQQIQQIQQAAELGDQQAAQIFLVIQQVAQQMQQQPSYKNGGLLDYYRKIKNICPEGYKVSYNKKGGKVCPVCQKAEQGTKVEEPKKENAVSRFKKQRDLMKCGGKTKK